MVIHRRVRRTRTFIKLEILAEPEEQIRCGIAFNQRKGLAFEKTVIAVGLLFISICYICLCKYFK